jgi:DinB superfamily
MNDLAELLERFRRGAELAAMTLTGAAGSEVDFVPAPGKWSVRQIVCHLSDAEMVLGMRLRRIIAEDNPPLEAFDQNAWTANLNYAKRKPSHALEMFRNLRSDNYELLKELPESAFDRAGMHSERGRITLGDLLRLGAEHAENHAVQVRSVRAAFKAAKAKPAS